MYAKKIVFSGFCFILMGICYSQKKPVTDSAAYYEKQISLLQKKMLDSLQKTSAYIELRENVLRVRRKRGAYSSFNLFTEINSADFGKFNTGIAGNGFSPLRGNHLSLGFGISTLQNRFISEFTYGIFGFAKKTKKTGEEISSNFNSLLVLDIGYDVVKARNINIYPYAGTGLRLLSLQYKKDAIVNSSFTNISNMVINNQSVDASSTKMALRTGLGLDLVISEKKDGSRGIILFMKGGINRQIGKENYKADGLPDFKPGISYGDWNVIAGIKFFSR